MVARFQDRAADWQAQWERAPGEPTDADLGRWGPLGPSGDQEPWGSASAEARRMPSPATVAVLGPDTQARLHALAERTSIAGATTRPCTVVDAHLLLYEAAAHLPPTTGRRPGLTGTRSIGAGEPRLIDATGGLFWITGLSGAGKSTLAVYLAQALRRRGTPVMVLDGDRLRLPLFRPSVTPSVAPPHGATDRGPPGTGGTGWAGGQEHERYAGETRRQLAHRYAALAALLSHAGQTVVCATVSAVPEVRALNRRRVPRYAEIWLDVPLAVAAARVPKGLYARARAGELRHVVGIDLPFLPPDRPEYRFMNTGPRFALARLALRIAAERWPRGAEQWMRAGLDDATTRPTESPSATHDTCGAPCSC